MVKPRYGLNEEQKAIWVYLEHDGEALAGVSLELLAKGRQLAGEVHWPLVGFLLGHQVADLADQAIAHGADEVVLAEHSLLKRFTVDAFTHVAEQALMAYKPSIFLLGATPDGRDMAGRLAVRLRTGLNADCTDLRLKLGTGVLVCEVSGFGGGVLALIEMQEHRPQMATIRPGVFLSGEADPSQKGRVKPLAVDLAEELVRTRIVEQVTGESLDLTSAPVLVVGGRGIDGRFDMMQELADLIDGDVGATRPPVDEGHIERERQIGQTGVICRPKVAIVCGVSGAFHFVIGIQEADLVIAINSDPDAPIFEFADYCITGDVHQVVPALISALRQVEHRHTPHPPTPVQEAADG
jgi:electron transfer flavoprotein alpha subunit